MESLTASVSGTDSAAGSTRVPQLSSGWEIQEGKEWTLSSPTETGELPLQATASQSNLLGSSLPQ